MRENQTLSSERAGLEQKLERHMLETNALSVQHASLKDILGERGINASEKRRSRALDSPSVQQRFSTPDLHRVRDLEQQLETNIKNQEELKTQYEEINERGEKMKREYEEKLTALDNDHQAAVKYLRGTEKMLSKMKQELQRVKNENGDLKKKLDKAKDDAETDKRDAPESSSTDLEAERQKMRQEFEATQSSLQSSVSELEKRITTMQQQMSSTETELQHAKSSHTSAQNDLTNLQSSFSQSRSDIERLQKENTLLEERAKDAENKVQLLLDQVEHSVDNYRRQSRMSTSNPPILNGTGAGHVRAPSGVSEASVASSPGKPGHSRNISTGGDSDYSAGGQPESAGGHESRNSMALDSLASELDALRTHWETTNKHYRLSDRFDFERTPTSAVHPVGTGGLADWRRGLELDEDEEGTRPGTSEESAMKGSSGQERDDMPTPTAT